MKSTLTKYKDTDLLVFQQLDDKSLLSMCLVDKSANKLCKNEYFWQNRFVNKFGSGIADKPADKTWRIYYLQTIKILDENKDLNKLLIESAENGKLDLVKISLSNGADIHTLDDRALRYSSENGHIEVVKYLKSLK